MNYSRRYFLSSSSLAAIGISAIGQIAKAQESSIDVNYNLTAEYQDLRTSWPYNNAKTLILRAEDFIVGFANGLVADEGDHQHLFDVSNEDMERLKNGEVVSIRTSEADGHTHLIKIDPIKFKVPGGTIIQVRKVIPPNPVE